MKGYKLTAGLLVAATLITSIPVDFLASKSAAGNNYITGTSVSFSAGATAAINETVVLNNTNNYYAGVEENDAPVVADAVDYSNMGVATNISEFVNIREEANTDADVVGKLYVNGVVTVLETLDGWYKIESGNVIGYISADYLLVGDQAAIEEAGERIAKVTTDTLRLRKEASEDAAVATLLNIGNKATVLDETTEGWVKVKYKSYEGYVAADYVSVETVYEYAESKEEEEARLAEERRQQQAAQQAAQQQAAQQQAAASQSQSTQQSTQSYNPPSGGSGQSVVDYAVQFVGNPYVWGGESLTNGADCSGFVKSVYAAFGVSLPHSSRGLRSVGYGVDASQVQPGDIICYSGHVAIYIGNGAIVHASNRSDGIKITYNWQYKTVLAIRRIF